MVIAEIPIITQQVIYTVWLRQKGNRTNTETSDK